MIPANYTVFGRRYARNFMANAVAYWRLDSNSNDSTAFAHNGTDTSISYSNAGFVSNCATFNGSTSDINFPQSTDFDFSNGSLDLQFSISMNVMFSSGGTYTTQHVFAKSNGSSKQYILEKNNTSLTLYLFSSGSIYKAYSILFSTLGISHGTLYNLIITYDGLGTSASVKYYVNGTGYTSGYSSSGVYTKMTISSQPFMLGHQHTVSNFFFNGRIDEYLILKGLELTATEAAYISAQMAAGNHLL